jgi:phage/plasmid-like protein (TIGR03299 family)
MSHAIDRSTGRPAVFVTRQPAWHGLGAVVQEAPTSADAIRLAGLDWEVQKWPLQAYGPDVGGQAHVLDVPEQFATVRTDVGAVLGVVSRRYRVFQNAEAFDFSDALVGEGLARYETAGALNGGRRVWLLARLPRELRVRGTEDVVEPYLLLANSHDGTACLRMVPTTVRVVCQNTLNLALGRAGSAEVTVRHRESLVDRVAEARQQLGLTLARVDRFQEEIDALARTPLSGPAVPRYFRSALELPALEELLEAPKESWPRLARGLLAEQSERQRAAQARLLERLAENFEAPKNRLRGIEGTAWAAYNAVSQYVDHQMRVGSAEARLNSVWFGNGDRLKQHAFARALQLAQAA